MRSKFIKPLVGLFLGFALGMPVLAQVPEPLIFPQFANGDFGGIRYRSTLILQNTGATAVRARLEFFRDNGSPYPVTFSDGRFGSVFDLPISPGHSIFLTTNGQGQGSSGWARVSNAVVGGTVIFSQYDSTDRLLAEAGVGATPPNSAFTIPVDNTTQGQYLTGVAFANAGLTGVGGTIRLLNSTGGEVAAREFPALAAMNHVSRFVTDAELFPNVGVGLKGSLAITTTAPVAAIGLRFARNFEVMTSLPTVAGVAPVGGRAPGLISLSTTSGGPGNLVTLNGTGFSGVAAQNSVRFDLTGATITSASTTSLTVLVPDIPSRRYSVTVTVGGQSSNGLDFEVGMPRAAELGAYKGLTSQGNNPIFFGTTSAPSVTNIYLTRTQYQAQCTRGSFLFDVFGPGGANGPIDELGRFSLTNEDRDVITGRFITPTHALGTITFAGFSDRPSDPPLYGTCPSVAVNFEMDYRPSVPVITSLSARGPRSDVAILFTATQPPGSNVSRFNLYLIDQSLTPILRVEDPSRAYDIPFPSQYVSTSFDGSIRLDLSGVTQPFAGVQLILQNADGSTINELSAPANAWYVP
ncbi:MAG: IPT/TIG domain-containing protein [Acidobacteria bacterium]|nr:IPT/TIG domain-containing protein [Acidobacteriota bacterium]MBI3655535.1 IPT/TIG domain-containing protein [Acidobacteriota bacterium]